MTAYDFLGYFKRDIAAFTLLSLGLITLKETNCHVVGILKQPYKEVCMGRD